jgi:hypothetical protein
MMPDVAAGLAERARASDLFGARHQDQLQGLAPDFVDYGLHHLAGVLNQVNDGEQDLPVGLAELLNDGSRLARSAGHDAMRFLHGGWLLSDSRLGLGNRILSKPGHRRLPTFN